MEKYVNLKELTKLYLHGSLSMIKMEYDNPDTTIVDVIYEDDSEYHFSYKIEVHNTSKEVTFLEHNCDYNRDHYTLKRDKVFEAAVAKYLFHR